MIAVTVYTSAAGAFTTLQDIWDIQISPDICSHTDFFLQEGRTASFKCQYNATLFNLVDSGITSLNRQFAPCVVKITSGAKVLFVGYIPKGGLNMITNGIKSTGAVKTMEIHLIDYLGALSLIRKYTESISTGSVDENFFFDFEEGETVSIYNSIKDVFDINDVNSPAIYGMLDWMRPVLTNELLDYPFYGVSVIDYELWRIYDAQADDYTNARIYHDGISVVYETLLSRSRAFIGLPNIAYYRKFRIYGTVVAMISEQTATGGTNIIALAASLVPDYLTWDTQQEYISTINQMRYAIASETLYRNVLQISGTITLTSITIGPATTINYADWANYALTLVMGSLVYRSGAGLGQVWALVNRAYNPAAPTVSLSANAEIFDYSEEYDATIQKLDNPLTFIVNGEYIGNRINDAVSWVQRNYPKLVKFSSTEYVAPGSLLSLPSYNAFPIFINSTAFRDGSNFTIYEYEGRTR